MVAFHAFSSNQEFKMGTGLVGALWRDGNEHGLTDDLFRVITVEFFGSMIPAGHHSVGGDAIDRVFGRFDDGCNSFKSLVGSYFRL